MGHNGTYTGQLSEADIRHLAADIIWEWDDGPGRESDEPALFDGEPSALAGDGVREERMARVLRTFFAGHGLGVEVKQTGTLKLNGSDATTASLVGMLFLNVSESATVAKVDPRGERRVIAVEARREVTTLRPGGRDPEVRVPGPISVDVRLEPGIDEVEISLGRVG